ncbi:UDP-glucose flavonoid 3-O-glucosyltransferase 7 [Arachis duranensis]|uniref:UDP-glucose flavonoid 3-O-glucosyltransferase 7 n=2 Tax=Arachis TaxID=3817 RepID=A0A6P4CZ87_ARADU|nr:UDP-glucose flavonoid 3-O-glucosyltransferase 7 [Arachis duranensis]
MMMVANLNYIQKKAKGKINPMKIYILPFLAPGHQIPIVHVAQLLASRGHHVTILTTPSNTHLLAEADNVNIHTLPFPSDQVGLPVGVENISAATDSTTASKIYTAAHLIGPQVESFMQQSPPDVFIPDTTYTWSRAVANRLGIPRLIFSPHLIFFVAIMEAIRSHPEILVDFDDTAPYTIPGLPQPITLSVKPSPSHRRLMESMVDAERDSLGVIVMSFKELDGDYAQYYEKITGGKVWHLGPTFLMVQKTLPLQQPSSDAGEGENECLRWLSSKKEGSVVYACFGSLIRLADKQLFQIAAGLEASGHQFVWVVRRNKSNKEKWLPDGFEERMKKEERGLLITGWAPQSLILKHAAIGCFLTHSGSSSVIEAASAGVVTVTMPGCGDHFFNEKLMTEVHGFGVEVGGAEWSLSPFNEKKRVVSADMIEKAVRKVMDGGEEAERMKKKAKEMQEKACRAVEEGGSSQQSLSEMIHQLEQVVVSTFATTTF